MGNGLRPLLATGLACVILASGFQAWAQEERRDEPRGGPGERHAEAQHREGDFRDRRDPRSWNDHDRAVWRGGIWHQDWHNGRYGWWWEVAGIWYFYDQPVYPFPPVVSALVDVPVAPGIGIGVVVPAPVVAIPPPPPPPQPVAPPMPVAAQPGTWYYCDSPSGYYPYVQACPTGWRPVPAQNR